MAWARHAREGALTNSARYGDSNVVASDIRKPEPGSLGHGPFVYADVLKPDHLERIIVEHDINWIVHFSALLSAIGERNPALALDVNIRGFQNVMELGTSTSTHRGGSMPRGHARRPPARLMA